MGSVTLMKLTGSTVYIILLLRFCFWQKVYYKAVDVDFPSDSSEAVGHIVGISDHCGHALTWKMLTQDSNTIIFRSHVHPFSSHDPNLHAEMFGGEMSDLSPAPIIQFYHESDHETNHISTTVDYDENKKNSEPPSAVFNPEDLVKCTFLFDPFNLEDLAGRTFLFDSQENGQQFCAKIVKLIKDQEANIKEKPSKLKFLLSVNDDKTEEVITYNKFLEFLAKEDDDIGVVLKFCHIISHQGPLKPEHNNYKGSTYNVMIKWENGRSHPNPSSSLLSMIP
jgi:hypothetical protein